MCLRTRCPPCAGASPGCAWGSWPRPSGTAWTPTCSPPTTLPSKLLEAAGARCETLELPRSVAEYGNRVGKLIGTEGYFHVGALVDDESLPIDDDVRPRIQLGRGVSAVEYMAMMRTRDDDKRAALAAMEGFDALLTPGTLTPAPVVDEIDQSKTPAHFTRMVNWLEWCALVVPNGAAANGPGYPDQADLAAHRLPRPGRGDGAPHRLGLRQSHFVPANPAYPN